MKVLQPRRFHPRKTLFVASVLIGYAAYTWIRSTSAPAHPSWSGPTMGTTYHITLADSPLKQSALDKLKRSIDEYLVLINQQMSTYLPDSEITRFNQSTSTEPFSVSADFVRVIRYALEMGERSGGLFDVTLDPLLHLWGFGHRGHPDQLPTAEEVETIRARVGYRHLRVPDDNRLAKDIPGLQLDLGGITPGFAVDEIARLIQEAGVSNLFVELGGECLVRGHSPRGDKWKIGIDVPAYDSAPGEAIQAILHVADCAVSTSGDYRDFLEDFRNGKIYTHILDPRTGYPVQHHLASVSVIAPTCMEADALATTLFVMGEDQGLAWLARVPGIEALFILRNADGSFSELSTPGFAAATGYTPRISAAGTPISKIP